MDGQSKPGGDNSALEQRIARMHRRLKEARSLDESPAVLGALSDELDKALDELHDRVTTARLETLYGEG